MTTFVCQKLTTLVCNSSVFCSSTVVCPMLTTLVRTSSLFCDHARLSKVDHARLSKLLIFATTIVCPKLTTLVCPSPAFAQPRSFVENEPRSFVQAPFLRDHVRMSKVDHARLSKLLICATTFVCLKADHDRMYKLIILLTTLVCQSRPRSFVYLSGTWISRRFLHSHLHPSLRFQVRRVTAESSSPKQYIIAVQHLSERQTAAHLTQLHQHLSRDILFICSASQHSTTMFRARRVLTIIPNLVRTPGSVANLACTFSMNLKREVS